MKNKELSEPWCHLPEEDVADLALIEEIFRRVNESQSVELYAPLKKKSSHPDIIARLGEIERQIILRAQKKGVF